MTRVLSAFKLGWDRWPLLGSSVDNAYPYVGTGSCLAVLWPRGAVHFISTAKSEGFSSSPSDAGLSFWEWSSNIVPEKRVSHICNLSHCLLCCTWALERHTRFILIVLDFDGRPIGKLRSSRGFVRFTWISRSEMGSQKSLWIVLSWGSCLSWLVVERATCKDVAKRFLVFIRHSLVWSYMLRVKGSAGLSPHRGLHCVWELAYFWSIERVNSQSFSLWIPALVTLL